jgi:hypothetical protein
MSKKLKCRTAVQLLSDKKALYGKTNKWAAEALGTYPQAVKTCLNENVKVKNLLSMLNAYGCDVFILDKKTSETIKLVK